MERFFEELFKVYGPKYIRYGIFTEERLQEAPFHLILITNRVMPLSIILSKMGQRFKIPVFHVPHGFCNGIFKDNKLIQSVEFDSRYFPYVHSHEILGSKLNLKICQLNGVDPRKLILGGMPQFELQRPPSFPEQAKAKRKLGFAPTQFIITFGTETSNDRTMNKFIMDDFKLIQLYKSLISTIARQDEFALIFKFRPNDPLISLVEKFTQECQTKNVRVFQDRLEEIFLCSDAIMVINSNIGLEALFHRIPIIQVLGPHGNTNLPLESQNAAIGLRHPEDLIEILARLKNDPAFRDERLKAQQKFLDENIPNRKGVSRLIADMIIRTARAYKEGLLLPDYSVAKHPVKFSINE